jgi:WD40 repeat protein
MRLNEMWLTVCAVLALLSGRCEAGTNFFSNAFGSTMSDVAVKVAELPEKYSDLIHRGLDFSPDGNRIAVESGGEKINIWDWRNQHIETTVDKAHGASGAIATNPLQYSPDGRMLAVCDSKGAGDVVVRIWNTQNWSIAKDLTDSGPGGCNALNFMPDGQFLIRVVDRAGLRGDNLIVHATADWQPVWSLHLERFGPLSLAVSPKGELAAIGGVLIVVQPGISDPVERLRATKFEPTLYIVNLTNHEIARVIKPDAMGPVQWSPDGTRVALAGHSYVEIFDPRSGERLVHEKIEGSGDQNVRYTPEGRYFIESDLNGRGRGLGVQIWDSQRLKLLQKIPGDVGSIDVSRDGKWLAVGDTGRTTIWRIQ